MRDHWSEQGLAIVHAGAASLRDGHGVLFCGRSRSGKSTLALALAIERGAACIADDLAVLADGRVRGLGAPVAVRDGSPYWKVARQLWYADESPRLLVRPEDLGAPSRSTSAKVDVLLFPSYGSSRSCSPVSAADALCRLMACTVASISDERIADLARFVATTPAFEVTYDSVDAALTTVDEAVEASARHVDVEVHRIPEAELVGLPADIIGYRFEGADVVVYQAGRSEVVRVGGWPAGVSPSASSWLGVTYGDLR